MKNAPHDFHALTITDLLEARDAYHRHLTHLDNVVGTAVGLYLIREDDPDIEDPEGALPSPGKGIRTLFNSDIRRWSSPCVLVFVDRWQEPNELRAHPEQFVPPRLYLPDDRIVPTCVVYAPSANNAAPPIDDILFSPDLLGGGYPVLSHVQGESRIGSIGCLVTDGHAVFALTNRHVAGPVSQESFSVVNGERNRIGEAVEPSLREIPLVDAYPGLPGFRTNVNLDAGLLRVDEISNWTSQVYGIGEIGELFQADAEALTLNLISRDVRAFGAASGLLMGKIKGLLYRYRSLAGFDFVTDFLIGPRTGEQTVPTRPGDSGTIWFLDSEPQESGSRAKHRPLAMQWGSQGFQGEDQQDAMQFALASNLTIICRDLNVRIITDWETGLSETWGKLGHFQVGAKACDLVANTKLHLLMQNNKEQVGLSDDDRRNRVFPGNLQSAFIALAYVPDLWWKSKRGNKEKSTHFADMDEDGADQFAGDTLMDLYESDPATLTPQNWHAFYESLGTQMRHQGSLPFRVKQYYEEMVTFVRDREVDKFVAAAGTLAHYIGDAGQPLHASRLHHGSNASESGVHAQYETSMIERFRDVIVPTITQRLDGVEIASHFQGAQRAAEVSIELIQFAFETLPPQTIIDSYNNAGTGRQRNEDMWNDLGDATLDCMIEASFYLAEIWESAWIEGGGNQIPNSELGRVSKNRLKTLYKNNNFVKSKFITEY